MLRARSVWFFTASNPRLTFGGMDGEPKKEMHDLLPPQFRPKYFNVLPSESFQTVKNKLLESGIDYPFIVKPEVGGQGILFRKIESESHLQEYHEKIPVEYFIQEYVRYPVEVSLFYYRFPGEAKGTISGFLQKMPMQVTGDGVHTLQELVESNSKAMKRKEELHKKHRDTWNVILPEGERYMLSYAANHNRGACFIDLGAEINDFLVSMLDGISHQVNDFFYGRYDIMCQSVEDLKKGRNFFILEYNGCGAEPNHFYDTGYSLPEAWKEILKHWKALYRISDINHRAGVAYWPFLKGLRFHWQNKEYYKKIKEADKEIS